MFSSTMSYYEIINALRDIEAFSFLMPFQQKLLQKSLDNPFILGMFTLYPAQPSVQKIINEALQSPRQERNNIAQEVPHRLSVHSSILAEQRARTKEYLLDKFFSQVETSLLSELESFIRHALESKEIVDELVVAHKLRLAEFNMPEPDSDELESLQKTIPHDFINYLEHLKHQKNNNTSFAWSVITCLLKRMQGLSQDQRIASELQFMRALDDGRTAYFGQGRKFYSDGTDYSCPQGLEERLLDHHAYLAEAIVKKDYEKNIEPLFAPFIESIKDENGMHLKYAPSQLLINLYARCAGYVIETKERVLFKLPLGITDESLFLLQQQYIAQKYQIPLQEVAIIISNSSSAVRHVESQSSELFMNRRAVLSEYRRINSLINILKSGLALYERNNIPDFMEFWQREQDICELLQISAVQQNLEFVHDGQLRTDDEIIAALVQSGPFIDKAHVLTIAALIPFHLIEAMLQADPTVNHINDQLCHKDSFLAYYCGFKESIKGMYPNYYDFYLPDLDQRLLSGEHMTMFICSEEVFLYFLRKNEGLLKFSSNRSKLLEKYAVLCAKNNCSRVLFQLISEFGVSPDTVNQQEQKTLLAIACGQGSADVVKVLLQLGASVNYKSSLRTKPPMHIAISHGYINIIREFLRFGVDIEQTNENCRDTPLMYAINIGNSEIADFLIESGASIDAITEGARTVLSAFQGSYLKNIASTQLLQKILNILKKDKSKFNYIVNLNPHQKYIHENNPALQKAGLATSIFVSMVIAKNRDAIDMLMNINSELELPVDFSIAIPFFSRSGLLETLQHCIEKSYISITDRDSDNKTLIDYATLENNLEIFEYLVGLHTTMFPSDSQKLLTTCWFQASKSGSFDILKHLKKLDKKLLTALDSEGRIGFFYAISRPGYHDIYANIYSKKIDFTQKDHQGHSILVHAINTLDDIEEKAISFLIEKSDNTMTREDFSVYYNQAVLAAMDGRKKRFFEILMTYFEQKTFTNELLQVSTSQELYGPYLERCQYKEVTLFAILVFSLLKVQKNKDGIRLTLQFIEKFAFDLLSQLERRLEKGEQLSRAEVALLNITIRSLWNNDGFADSYRKRQTKASREKSTGLLLSSDTNLFFKILNKFLLIKIKFTPKNYDEFVFEPTHLYDQKAILPVYFTEKEERKIYGRELLDIIIRSLAQGYDLMQFKRVLFSLSTHFDILQVIAETTNSSTLLYITINKILPLRSLQAYENQIIRVREYAMAHNKKDIHLLLNSYASKYPVEQVVESIGKEKDIERVIQALRDTFGKTWYLDAIFGIFALSEQYARHKSSFSTYYENILDTSNSFKRNLIFSLLRAALSSLSKYIVSVNPNFLTEEQVGVINTVLALLKESQVIKEYDSQDVAGGQITAAASFTMGDLVQEIIQGMERLSQESKVAADAIDVAPSVLIVGSKRMRFEIEAQDVENTRKIRRISY